MLLKIAGIGLAIYAVLAMAVFAMIENTGLLVVHVQDKVKHKSVFVPVPMLMVNGALGLVPGAKLNVARERLDQSDLKWFQAFSRELASCPDVNFLEVQTATGQVLISKRGSNLLVDVNTPENSVYVRVPLHAAEKTLTQLLTK